jgi:hypothetical protein
MRAGPQAESRFWADPGPGRRAKPRRGCGPRRVSVVSRAMNLLQLMRDAVPREPVASLASVAGRERACHRRCAAQRRTARDAGGAGPSVRPRRIHRPAADGPAAAGGPRRVAAVGNLTRARRWIGHRGAAASRPGPASAAVRRAGRRGGRTDREILGIARRRRYRSCSASPAPLALAVIARAVAGASLSAAQLASTLREQQAVLQSAAPAGLDGGTRVFVISHPRTWHAAPQAGAVALAARARHHPGAVFHAALGAAELDVRTRGADSTPRGQTTWVTGLYENRPMPSSAALLFMRALKVSTSGA